jgi:hypothetical protein
VGNELRVSGEIHRVLVLPAMKAVRHSTLQKAVEFHRAGGVVLAVGALPEASDRVGRDDPEVAAMVKEIFPDGTVNDIAANVPGRDYELPDSAMTRKQGSDYVMHRKIGPRDLYAVYGMPQATVCKFRAISKAALWDPWTGETRPLPVISQKEGITELALPLSEKEIQLIVFSPGAAERPKAESAPQMTRLELGGEWEFELKPTLDNRFGDYHWPPTQALIGAEATVADWQTFRRPFSLLTRLRVPQQFRGRTIALRLVLARVGAKHVERCLGQRPCRSAHPRRFQKLTPWDNRTSFLHNAPLQSRLSQNYCRCALALPSTDAAVNPGCWSELRKARGIRRTDLCRGRVPNSRPGTSVLP